MKSVLVALALLSAPARAADLSDLAWLAGEWRGTGLGGEAEEVWSPPIDGAMVGHFRLVKDGKAKIYEFEAIREIDGTLVYQVKHFSPALVGWEDKDKTTDFKFVKKEGRKIVFEGAAFEPVSETEMRITVGITQKDGTKKDEAFTFRRVR